MRLEICTVPDIARRLSRMRHVPRPGDRLWSNIRTESALDFGWQLDRECAIRVHKTQAMGPTI